MLAHAGHWLAGLIYLAPVALVVAFLGLQHLRTRHGPGCDIGRLNDPTLDEVMDRQDPLR